MGFFKKVSEEMGQVTWPTGKELLKYTVTVVTTVIVAAVFFAGVDTLIAKAIELFVRL